MSLIVEILEIQGTSTRFRVFESDNWKSVLGLENRPTRREFRKSLRTWLANKFREEHSNQEVFSHWELYDFAVWNGSKCLSAWDGDKYVEIDEDYKEVGEDWFYFHAMNFFAKRKPSNPAFALREMTPVEKIA